MREGEEVEVASGPLVTRELCEVEEGQCLVRCAVIYRPILIAWPGRLLLLLSLSLSISLVFVGVIKVFVVADTVAEAVEAVIVEA